jgi:hypothetical protein
MDTPEVIKLKNSVMPNWSHSWHRTVRLQSQEVSTSLMVEQSQPSKQEKVVVGPPGRKPGYNWKLGPKPRLASKKLVTIESAEVLV